MIKRLFEHPLTKGLALDDPRTTELRRLIIQEKSFLKKLYTEWYYRLLEAVPGGPGSVLEIGSGGGFISDLCPKVITSEVFWCSSVDLVLDARRLPFSPGSLRSILMVDVFHHIADVETFLAGAVEALRQGGVLAMIEPWMSPWARLVYGRLHHEPFAPNAKNWRLPEAGPLSGANSALPWIVFHRDLKLFQQRFPLLHLLSVEPGYPFSYLASGGVSLRSLTPGWLYAVCRGFERLLDPSGKGLSCFALITLKKV